MILLLLLASFTSPVPVASTYERSFISGVLMNAGSPSTDAAASSDADTVMETDEALESGQEERSRGYLVCQLIRVQSLLLVLRFSILIKFGNLIVALIIWHMSCYTTCSFPFGEYVIKGPLNVV